MRPCEPQAIPSVFPRGVICVETLGDELAAAPLYPEEALSVALALPRRQREFARGRDCARRALAGLGAAPRSIPVGPRREPIWPPGFVGSITHTDGYCAAAVGLSTTFAALGMDVERNEPLPSGVLARIASANEQHAIAALPVARVAWDRLLFSAKESVFKSWWPLTTRWIAFEEVAVAIIPETSAPYRGTFEARVASPVNRTDHTTTTRMRGSYALAGHHILTGVAISACSRAC